MSEEEGRVETEAAVSDPTSSVDSPVETPPAAPRSRRSRSCLLGCGMLLILLVTAGWILLADDSPPDDADLRPTPRPLYADEDSVWIGLMELHGRIEEWPRDGSWSFEYGSRLVVEDDEDDLFGPDPWTPSPLDRSPPIQQLGVEMAEYFEGPGRAIEEFERILARPGLGIPLRDDPLETTVGYSEVREFVKLSSDRALLSRIRGDADACAEHLLRNRRLGVLLVREPNLFLEALTGIAFVHHSTCAVESLLYDPLPSKGWEQKWLAEDVLFSEGSLLFAEGMRNEYLIYPELIEETREQSFWASIGIKKNRTLRRIGEEFRVWIDRAAQPPWQREAPRAVNAQKALRRVLWERNVGEPLVEIVVSAIPSLLRRYDRCALLEQACRTLLALRIYDRRFGALPPDLETLVAAVEDYDAVPIDPYSGRPLGYDPDLRIIYSVGEDGIDQGGACWAETLAGDESRYSLPDMVWLLPKLPDR